MRIRAPHLGNIGDVKVWQLCKAGFDAAQELLRHIQAAWMAAHLQDDLLLEHSDDPADLWALPCILHLLVQSQELMDCHMGVPTAAEDHAVCEKGSHFVPVQNVWHMRVHHDSNDSTEGLIGLDDSLAYPYQDRGSVVPAEPFCGHVKKCYPLWSQHPLKGLSFCWTDNSPPLGVQHARALHRVPIIPWPGLP